MNDTPFLKLFFTMAFLTSLAACDGGSSSSSSTDTDTDADEEETTTLVSEPSITGRTIGDSEFTISWEQEFDDGGDDDQEVTYNFYLAEEEIEIDEDENGDFADEDLSLDDLEARFDTLLGSALIEGAVSPLTIDGLSNDTTYYFVITATTEVEVDDETVLSTSDPSNEVIAIPRASLDLVVYNLNDTGYSGCGDYSFFIDLDEDGVIDADELDAFSGNHNNDIDCINGQVDPDGDTTPEDSLQDALNGRDYLSATSSLVKTGAGLAGFDFTKLDENGNTLDEGAATWSCVQDNNTGLIWEAKTSNGLHNTDDRYTWYNDDILSNGGFEGYELVTDFDSSESNDRCFGYSSGDETSYCNSQAFVERVNIETLCGASDWRMPTREETLSLVYFQSENIDEPRPVFNLSIDSDFFPNTAVSVVTDSFESARYMTGSPYAESLNGIWGVFFGTGTSPVLSKGETNPIRLVRTAP